MLISLKKIFKATINLVLLCVVFGVAAEDDASRVENQNEWNARDKNTQSELNKSLQLASPPIQLPKEITLDKPADESLCFTIKEIKIEGLLSDWAIEQGARYIGQCIGFKTIQAYIRVINQKILADGYITSRAVLPEQNIASGVLEISIQEGVIEKIQFPDDYPFSSYYSLPLTIGGVLNLRDMEQAVDQLNRLHSQNIEFKVQPGTYKNASILMAEVKLKKRTQMTFSVDDSGSDATGNYPISLNIVMDNVFGIQDSLTSSLSNATAGITGESNSSSFSWRVPVGYSLFELTRSSSNYQQETIGDVRNFELSGTSEDHKLGVAHVIFRDNNSKTSLLGSIKTRKRRSYIDDTEIEVQRRNLTELSFSAAYRRYISNAVLDVSITLHQGVELFNTDSADSGATDETPQPDYRFYSSNASLSKPFSAFGFKMNYVGQLAMQYADTAIYSLDYFSNGGRYTVRGFASDESLSMEHGWRLKNDVSIPLPLQAISVTSYFGLDVGQVFGDDNDESGETLMGTSFGVKGHAFGVSYDLFASMPFIEYGPYAERGGHIVNASLSAQF